MSLLKIAWRSIQRRSLASILTALSMALGVTMVVAVLLIMGIVSDSFQNNSSLGYNMIVGAKGGSLQLVLNTVYHLSSPVENVPYTFYEEFLSAEECHDGKQGQYAALTQFAIPVCMGDYYRGFRVVGTTARMFDNFVFDTENDRKYEFADGHNFEAWNPQHGFFEAVLGAKVATDTGLRVGDTFSPTHGPQGESHDKFFIVGVLKSTGTPNDRAAFVNMEGFFLLEGHAKPVPEDDTDARAPVDENEARIPGLPYPLPIDDELSELDEKRRYLKPLPISQREVTSILLRTVSTLVSPGLRNSINEGPHAQAVMPILEIHNLFNKIVGPIRWVLLLITVMICVVSGVSILVSIYNSMSDRRHEIAVMRALGAGRRTVMSVVLLESVLLSLGGGLLGWTLGHVLIGMLASPMIEDRTGVSIGIFDLAPEIRLFEKLGNSPIMEWGISTEFLLIPGLMLLAIVVGFLPALSAYRTDVARAISSSP